MKRKSIGTKFWVWSKTKKRSSKGKRLPAALPAIYSLPNELVTDVLARVAASSFNDLFSAKISCKIFLDVADDEYIYRQVSPEEYLEGPWKISKGASSFWDKCMKSGNAEALYRQGVVEYFSHMKFESGQSGLECLKKAANIGHLGASYLLGIILLCSEDEFREQGIQFLSIVRRSKKLGECRKKLKNIIRRIWLKNKFILEPKPNCCPMQEHHKKREGWPTESDNEDDDMNCEECRWNCEVISVCNMLRGVRSLLFSYIQ